MDSGTQCVKLLVSVWSADWEESNKQAMLQKTDGTLPQELQFIFPCSQMLKGKLRVFPDHLGHSVQIYSWVIYRTSLDNKGFITWLSGKFILRYTAGSPKRAR